jgi:hypothetical protein
MFQNGPENTRENSGGLAGQGRLALLNDPLLSEASGDFRQLFRAIRTGGRAALSKSAGRRFEPYIAHHFHPQRNQAFVGIEPALD